MPNLDAQEKQREVSRPVSVTSDPSVTSLIHNLGQKLDELDEIVHRIRDKAEPVMVDIPEKLDQDPDVKQDRPVNMSTVEEKLFGIGLRIEELNRTLAVTEHQIRI